MSTKEVIADLLISISRMFEPIDEAFRSPGALFAFLSEFGWINEFTEEDMSSVQDILGVACALDGIREIISTEILSTDDYSSVVAEIDRLSELIKQVFDCIANPLVPRNERPEVFPFNQDEFWHTFPSELPEYLLYRYFETYHASLHGILKFLGILSESEIDVDSVPGRVRFVRREVHWERVPKVLTDQTGLMNEVYKWGDEKDPLSHRELLQSVGSMLDGWDFPSGLISLPDTLLDEYYDGTPDEEGLLGLCSNVFSFYSEAEPDGPKIFTFEILTFPVPPPTDKSQLPSGLVLAPVLTGTAKSTFNLAPGLQLTIEGGFESEGGIRALIQPGSLELRAPEDLGTDIDAAVRLLADRSIPFILLGRYDTSRLEVGRFELAILASAKADGSDSDFGVEFSVDGAALVICAGEGDGFLRKVLPADPVEIGFDLGFGISSRRGFYIRGGAGLAFTLHLHKSCGPILINSIELALVAQQEGLALESTLTGGVDLGPVAATIRSIGLKAAINFDRPGLLGDADISLGFKPPDGVGLAIEAGGITGGGFLEFDDANQRYAGVLALNFGEIGLTAIGLITTRMPDGSDGFALLINIGVTFDPPIQLSFGFTLSGVGGLIGVNRTMEIEALRKGLKSHTLDSILFPDPERLVANANQIISDLRSVFPPQEGRYVVGPMVKIGWGTPNIITADIGLFLEFPDPVRLVLMGQVAAVLPSAKEALVVIHLDVLGVLDFAKEELTFQASLYDSHILKYTLSGDAAFLLGWGRAPRFALSIGGFHPRFKPPPPATVFADLKRLALSIDVGGDKLNLACQAYQALTPNSLQFGARVDLHASAAGATVDGYLSFDALIYFSPFAFEVEMGGGVGIKYAGISLLEIYLNLKLSGPRPWHAQGTARIKILLLPVDVDFNLTWGEDVPATLEAVDPWALLQTALAEPGNWGGQLPAGQGAVECLRPLEGTALQELIVHPAGRLEVRQNVVPLGEELQKVGNAPIKENRQCDIVGLSVDVESSEPESSKPEEIKEYFALGQFKELTNEERLSKPAFEKCKAGVTMAASSAVRLDGSPEVCELAYDDFILRADGSLEQPSTEMSSGIEWSEAEVLGQSGLSRTAAHRAGPRQQFSVHRPDPKIHVTDQLYCIVNAENLKVPDPGLEPDLIAMERSTAERVLQEQLVLHPVLEGTLIVIPECEVAA